MKVRFHLARGDNYRKWQIRGEHTLYVDPERYQLEMLRCTLVSRAGAAARVHSRGVKSVCGWVECDEVYVLPREHVPTLGLRRVRYNPIATPHWLCDDAVVDGSTYHKLVTHGREVCIP